MVLISGRITFAVHLSDILEYFDDEAYDILVTEEVGTKEQNPHIHFVVVYEKTLSTFRQRLVKQFPFLKEGNKYYSIKEIPKEELDPAIRYICKGLGPLQYPQVWRNTMNIDTVDAHKRYWEIFEKTKTEKANKANKTVIEFVTMDSIGLSTPKKKIVPWLTKIVQELAVDGELEKLTYVKDVMSYVYKYMLKRLGDDVKQADGSIIRKLVIGAVNSLRPLLLEDYLWEESGFGKMFGTL